ncbi:MAG TPA: DUF6665 family protein [Allosphingosinicella sp.]|jgi:hypothetical protein
MTFRPPRLAGRIQQQPSPLEVEVLGEMAAALAASGRRVEAALAGLAATPREDADRPHLLKAAAAAVYAYFIQRELCGLRDHRPVIDHYEIPAEVLARLGAC